MKIKRLPARFRFGGTTLDKTIDLSSGAQPDGIRRANETCIELDTYGNLTNAHTAGFMGVSIVISMLMSMSYSAVFWNDWEILFAIIAWSPALPCFALAFYLASGAHRCRGTFIRINRITRKIYYTHPKRKSGLLVLDWENIEAIAGLIPVVTPYSYTSRHPLYLVGVDYSTVPPSEVCLACGNSGGFEGKRSAIELWQYINRYMSNGLEGLPAPAPSPALSSRQSSALMPFRQWLADFKAELREPRDWLWAPIIIPLRLTVHFLCAVSCSSEAWLQYNVPYASFPHDNDVLCGFAKKRKPVIRVNGIKIED